MKRQAELHLDAYPFPVRKLTPDDDGGLSGGIPRCTPVSV